MDRLLLAFAVALLASPPASALVAGGGSRRSDCYAEWHVTTPETGPTAGRVGVDCHDGDPSCDADGEPNDVCAFDLAVCILQNDPGLTECSPPARLTRLKIGQGRVRPLFREPPLDQPGCREPARVLVPLRQHHGTLQPSRSVKLRMRATAAATPRHDDDRLRLRCLPPVSACPPNPSGAEEPNEVVLTVASTGTDLDNGWKGITHNFPVPAGTTLHLCLENCDATTNPACDATIPTGAGTANGTMFGPPLPLFTAGVPVCVVNAFAAPLFEGGRADLASGAIDGHIALQSHVFLTDETNVCPRCLAGRCNDGPNLGRACTVHGTVTVQSAATADKVFSLSKDCPPFANSPAGTISIDLPLTAGTSTLLPLPGGTAQTPCVARPGEARGITPSPDNCGAGTCTGPCDSDPKGGVNQVCCSSQRAQPCFPTGPGSIGKVERVGVPTAPVPAWPDPSYPKASDLVAVATFCEPATGTTTVDALAGLPGPGALILPASAHWLAPAGQ